MPNPAPPGAAGDHKNWQPPKLRRKTPEEVLREATNAAAVSVVATGFRAIDEMAEVLKDELKRLIIRGLGGRQ